MRDAEDLADLASLIEAFLARRRVERITPGVVNANRRALFLLLEAVRARRGRRDAQPVPAIAVTLEDLLGVLARLRENGLANGTISSYATAFRLFFGDLYDSGLLLFDPSDRLPSLADDHLPRHVPGFKEMARLLALPDTATDEGLHDRAILELLYGSGLRRAELLALETRDIDLAGRTAFIRDGKGRKDRVVPITREAARWIAVYLSRRPPHDTSSRLFLITSSSLYKRGRQLFKRAGLHDGMTLHSIRHACALHLLEGGADLVSIKKLLGHASVDTTAVYLKLTTAHLRRALERAHPRERGD